MTTHAIDALEEMYAKAWTHDNDEQLERLYDTIKAALTTAPEWQPIETAPRDGTAILVCLGNCVDADAIHTARFASKAKMYLGLFGGKFNEGWYCIDRNILDFNPTHWMPLPQPPKIVVGEG